MNRVDIKLNKIQLKKVNETGSTLVDFSKAVILPTMGFADFALRTIAVRTDIVTDYCINLIKKDKDLADSFQIFSYDFDNKFFVFYTHNNPDWFPICTFAMPYEYYNSKIRKGLL